MNRSSSRSGRSRPIRSVKQQLNEPDGDLKKLLDRLEQLNALDSAVAQVLGEPLCRHCRVANVRDNVLVISVDSSSFAAPMRFRAADLLLALRQKGFHHLVSVETMVQPN